jgi:hypothetical protein
VKPTGLIVAAAVLAVLGGAVWWSNKKQAAEAKAPSASSPKILTIADDQFREIHIKKLTGEVEDLKRENGKWEMTEPKQLAADQDTAASMVSTLGSLSADKLIEDKAADLQAYGLHVPTLDITITRKDGKTDQLLIGDDTPTGSGAYAMLAGSPKVYTVSSYVKTSLDKTPDDLRDKRLLTFDQDKLTRVELQAKGQTIEFGKNSKNEWQIVKPRPLRADNSVVETLVSRLKDAKMDLTGSDADKKFAAGTKVGVATVTDAGGSQTLEVRKDKDNYFAKSSVVPGEYQVAADTGEALNKTLDDFRNKKLFDFGFSDPGKVDLKGASYTKSGDKWMSGSKTMDNTSVQNLIDKLRDLSATRFADKGAGEQVFQATVTSDSGKRVETVTIAKQGDQYFAKRENEPSIYVLDGKAVGDLEKAAADVKEAAPPAPAKKK